jgi:hypothetical protein
LLVENPKKINSSTTERIPLAFQSAFRDRDRLKTRMRRTHHDYDQAYPMDRLARTVPS